MSFEYLWNKIIVLLYGYFENINDAKSTDIMANVYKNKVTKSEEPEYEECLSCQ